MSTTIQAWVINAERKLQMIELSKLSQVENTAKYTWIHIEADPPSKAVKEISGLPYHVLNTLGEGESRPRSEVLEDGLLVNFRCPPSEVKHDIQEFASFRVWVTERLIVTVQRRPLDLAKSAVKQLSTAMPETSLELLTFFMSQIIEKTADIECAIDDELDRLEDLLAESSAGVSRLQLGQLNKQIIMVRRYLVPQREALAKIHLEKFPWVKDIVNVQFREYTDSTIRILEDLAAARERTTVLQESLTSVSLEQTNKKIYLLSIVAVIFMPLSFVTGLLGINVGGIPGNTYKDGFWVVCTLLGALAFFELWMLRRKKWL